MKLKSPLILLSALALIFSFSLSAKEADIKKEIKEVTNLRLEHAKTMHTLKTKFSQDEYNREVAHIKEMGSLISNLKPGDKDQNKELLKKIQEKQRDFRKEQKEQRHIFHDEKLRPIKDEMREKMREIHKTMAEKHGVDWMPEGKEGRGPKRDPKERGERRKMKSDRNNDENDNSDE